jgi:hypothetical protein
LSRVLEFFSTPQESRGPHFCGGVSVLDQDI